MSDPVAVERMVSGIRDSLGGVDILVSNAGLRRQTPFVQMSLEEWRETFAVNVEGVFLVTKAALPVMIEAERGSVIIVGSITGKRPLWGRTPYAASKGAVEALTRAMAADHGREGIRVNAIAPGPVYTPMVYARGMSDAAREARRKASALGIEGTPWDIAYAAVFLCSDEARYVTGVTLNVDGGVLVN